MKPEKGPRQTQPEGNCPGGREKRSRCQGDGGRGLRQRLQAGIRLDGLQVALTRMRTLGLINRRRQERPGHTQMELQTRGLR